MRGATAIVALFRSFFDSLPDLKATELDIALGTDTVWVRFAVEGTDRGGMFGQAPTGKVVKWEETDIYRVQHGKIVEEWNAADLARMLAQIGLLTLPAAA